MKTAQNKIWMRFLVLGAFSLLTLSFSCRKSTDYVQNAEFYFENQTTHQVVLDYSNNRFIIEPGKSFISKPVQDGPKYPTAETYHEPITELLKRKQAEVLVKIDDKCFVSTDSSEHSIINIKSYVPEKIDAHTYKFTYTFTQADYEKAEACP